MAWLRNHALLFFIAGWLAAWQSAAGDPLVTADVKAAAVSSPRPPNE